MTVAYDVATDAFERGGMTEAEAEVYVMRELEQYQRAQVADRLGKEESTVDTLHQRAKKKAALPPVTKIGKDYPTSITIWFENDAQLRYRWDDEREEIVEETFLANDPHSVYEELGVGGEQSELPEYALESLGEYINEYQNDPEACRKDWTPVYGALTLHN